MIPEVEVEDTPQAISALQRRLANFENVLVLLGKQVNISIISTKFKVKD